MISVQRSSLVTVTQSHAKFLVGVSISLKATMLLLLFILTANGFLPGGSGTTIRHNTQITHIKQNNTQHSNKAT
jgi:hypothetical protein